MALDFSLLTYSIGLAAAFGGGFIDSIAGGGGLVTMPALLLCGVPSRGQGACPCGQGSQFPCLPKQNTGAWHLRDCYLSPNPSALLAIKKAACAA